MSEGSELVGSKAESPPAGESSPRSSPLDRGEIGALAVAAALLVVWIPFGASGQITPRMALALLLAGPGLVVVAVLARQRDRAAQLLVALLGWALVAALSATLVRPSLIGSYGADTGWIWMVAYVGAWGAGRWLRPRARRPLAMVIVVGATVNALFAVLEAAFEPTGALAPQEGRVAGLLLNPVYLGAILSGALALSGRLASIAAPKRWLLHGGIVVMVAGANLSGSRAALVGGSVLALVGAWVSWGDAPRSSGVAGRRSVTVALVGVAIVAGLVLSTPWQSPAGSTARAVEVSTSSGYQSRTLAWGFGLEATAERPVLGWGPGRFREAFETRTTAAYVRAEGPDRLFFDAHNVFVEYLVTTGVVGLGLLIGFVYLAVRHVRGPLAWFVVGVGLTWLLNPLSVVTAPLTLLVVGAAWTARSGSAPPSRPVIGRVGAVAASVLVVLAVGLGSLILVTDQQVHLATSNAALDPARTAQSLNPGDATLTGLVTEAEFAQITADGPSAAQREAIVASARRATEEDPTRARWWVRLGIAEGAFGDGGRDARLDAAEAAFRRALERNPWSVEAMSALAEVRRERGDDAEVAELEARLCEVGFCAPAE